MTRLNLSCIVIGVALSGALRGQSTPEMREVLDRLAKLEELDRARSNEIRDLTAEIQELRSQLLLASGTTSGVPVPAETAAKPAPQDQAHPTEAWPIR